MRETFSESWMVQIIAAFMLLFIAFLCLMITYGKSIKSKNQVTSIIEKYNGIDEESVKIINDFLVNTSYKGKGPCPENYQRFDIGNGTNWCAKAIIYDTSIRFKIVTFYNFNIPAFGNVTSFNLSGQTIDLNLKTAKYKTVMKAENIELGLEG